MAQQAARGQQHNIEAPKMRLELVAAGDPDAGGLFDALTQLGRDGFERGLASMKTSVFPFTPIRSISPAAAQTRRSRMR